MTSVIDGTRFARAATTRKSIVDSASELFCEQGYRFVSLRDIAARAGISHPALLKHFNGREELLAEVAKRLDASSGMPLTPGDPAGPAFASQARRQASVPGYVPFFAALTGEASAPSHPLHVLMRERTAHLTHERKEALERAVTMGLVDGGRNPADEAKRLTAAWAGLQMLERFVPSRVSIEGALQYYEALLARPVGWRATVDKRAPRSVPLAPALPPLLPAEPVETMLGYRTGRERRSKIVDGAMTLFAQEGYGDTSLLDIATKVGVSKSALYHHFASKDALLHEVLRERDHRIDDVIATAPAATAADTLRRLADGAYANEVEQPGLIELYAVISSEATPQDHAAHVYFEQRFAHALDGFTRMFEAAAQSGDLPAHRDPAQEALWVLALWDGLQYLWLYDHASIDVAGQLRAHLADVLPQWQP